MQQNEADLTIVVPAFNEENSLKEFLPLLLKECDINNWELLIVNDGSTDRTVDILNLHITNKRLRIINHKLNKGYGSALKSGILRANTEFVITIDADGQHKFEDIHNLYNLIKGGNADLVVGKRSFDNNFYRTIGKKLIRFFAKRLMEIPIQDLNSGMKIYRTEIVKQFLKFCPDGMAFSDIITLIFIHNRFLVIETDISLNKRKFGESTISTKTALSTIYEILNIVLMFNPIKIFLPSGLFFILIGVGWGLPIVLADRGVSVAAALSISVGIIIIFFGLIAEQIAQIRKQL